MRELLRHQSMDKIGVNIDLVVMQFHARLTLASSLAVCNRRAAGHGGETD
jgi:hypothetical protein